MSRIKYLILKFVGLVYSVLLGHWAFSVLSVQGNNIWGWFIVMYLTAAVYFTLMLGVPKD